MLVSDVVKTALILVGRKDAADAVDTQSYLQDTSLSHAVTAMLHCYNAVEDELARGFFPLETEQNFNTINGTVKFASFTHAPIKIVSVASDGKKVGYRIYPEYLDADAKYITVRYMYCPVKKQLTDESDYGGYPVGERMLAMGAAAEYCLIEGAFEDSENWEKRYRDEIARFRSYEKAEGYIPARAWV